MLLEDLLCIFLLLLLLVTVISFISVFMKDEIGVYCCSLVNIKMSELKAVNRYLSELW